jgi:hypothetical protein
VDHRRRHLDRLDRRGHRDRRRRGRRPTLLAEAPDEESLARVQHVLGSHLERFGQRNELAVTWTEDRP